MEHKDPDILAVLKFETAFILGKVLSVNSDELVFESFSDAEIPSESFQHIDVFNKGQIHFRKTTLAIKKTIN